MSRQSRRPAVNQHLTGMANNRTGRRVERKEHVRKDITGSEDSRPIAVLRGLDKSGSNQIKEYWSSLLGGLSPPTRSNISEDGLLSDDTLRNILKAEIRAHVGGAFPERVIKLPEMELMRRHEVIDYIIQSDQTTRDSFTEWSRTTHGHGTWDFNAAITAFVKDTTKFAYLSHIWEQGEVLYQSFSQDRDASPGYRKLLEFCRIAHEVYGVEFAWCDSLCIDSTKSMETREAVRSMFMWCRESFICIVYLAGTNTLLDFPFDRWFTRAWTLQELLAPPQIKFYNRNWQPLTDFRSDKLDPRGIDEEYVRQVELLGHGISIATGIPLRHIYRFQPGLRDPPFPERMKWLSRRTSTKSEDMVYSMLGILGVSMAPDYGEGLERAFFRLFQAVLEVDWSPSWFLWGGKPISTNVHPSRMIPASPTCYSSWDLECDPFNDITRPLRWDQQNTGKRGPIALTNTGLPIEVLVVPARVAHRVHVVHTIFTTQVADVTCPVSDDTVTVAVPGSAKLPVNLKEQFALGILDHDFSRQHSPRRIYAILLRRCHGLAPFAEKETVWQCGEWERWETGKIITFGLKDEFCRMNVDEWKRVEILRSEVGWEEQDIVCNPEIEFRSLLL